MWVLTSEYFRLFGRAPAIGQENRKLSASLLTGHSSITRLPLVTLYITERCNSRCVTCDYWRQGRSDLDLGAVLRLLPSFAQLGTRVAVLSGGEPLLNPDWPRIAAALRTEGLQVWLLTSGLSLAKQARRAAELFHHITVSLDGTDAATYARIRGLDAFDKVCEGIRAAADHGVPAGIRVTLQRANYRQLPAFVDLAKRLGARSVSFLAVDVANPHAFGRSSGFAADLALRPEDLPVFEEILRAAEQECREDFRSGFIAESPQKLRRIHQYFAAIRGETEFPAVRCNAPEFSAVIDAAGRVQPCFFIAGPPDARVATVTATEPGNEVASVLAGALNGSDQRALRSAIRRGERPECRTCVCSLWRDPGALLHFGGLLAEAIA